MVTTGTTSRHSPYGTYWNIVLKVAKLRCQKPPSYMKNITPIAAKLRQITT